MSQQVGNAWPPCTKKSRALAEKLQGWVASAWLPNMAGEAPLEGKRAPDPGLSSEAGGGGFFFNEVGCLKGPSAMATPTRRASLAVGEGSRR